MKLEQGKYYKTRDGRKVGPIRQDPDFIVLYDCPTMFGDEYHWYEDGEAGACSSSFCADLIEEWKEGEPMAGLTQAMNLKLKGAAEYLRDACLVCHYTNFSEFHVGTRDRYIKEMRELLNEIERNS